MQMSFLKNVLLNIIHVQDKQTLTFQLYRFSAPRAQGRARGRGHSPTCSYDLPGAQ